MGDLIGDILAGCILGGTRHVATGPDAALRSAWHRLYGFTVWARPDWLPGLWERR
jgi:hypothetical protein